MYLEHTPGDWGPAYMCTSDIYKAVRFETLRQVRWQCDPDNSYSVAGAWSSEPRSLRPVEIKINAEIIIL